MVCATVVYAPAFAASNAVGIWHLDEGSGQVAHDTSGYGNNGQLGSATVADLNDPTWTAGRFGQALQFDGVHSWVRVPDSAALSITGSITLEAWIKVDSYQPSQPILAKWNDITSPNGRSYALTLLNGNVRFDVSHNGLFGGGPCNPSGGFSLACTGSAAVLSQAVVPLGKWSHVAGVFDAATRKLQVFVDGTPDTSVIAQNANVWDTGEPLLIGTSDFGGGSRLFFAGAIDEARVWKRALSPEEVGSSAQAGMRGLWHFNGNGTDSSGYGNGVTAMNGASFTAGAKYGSNALALDGVDDFATAPGSAALAVTGSITVEAWVKINSLPTMMSGGIPVGFAPIASMWNDLGANNQRGYLLSVVSDGSVRFDVSHDGGFNCGLFPNTGPQSCAASHGALVISSAKVTLGSWTHIAGVFDAGTKTLQVFVNGVADTSQIAVGSNVFHSSAPFMVGAADTGHIARQFTNGSIDELHLWGRALSPLEIGFLASPVTGAELLLPDLVETDNGGIAETEWQPGKTTPVMVLEFLVPDNPGTQITAIDGAGPHLPGWVTGNSALDALITGKKDNGKTVELHIDFNQGPKLGAKIQFDPGQH